MRCEICNDPIPDGEEPHRITGYKYRRRFNTLSCRDCYERWVRGVIPSAPPKVDQSGLFIMKTRRTSTGRSENQYKGGR